MSTNSQLFSPKLSVAIVFKASSVEEGSSFDQVQAAFDVDLTFFWEFFGEAADCFSR